MYKTSLISKFLLISSFVCALLFGVATSPAPVSAANCPASENGNCFAGALCRNGMLVPDATCANANGQNAADTGQATIDLREKATNVLPGIPDTYDPTDPRGAFGTFIGRILNIAFTVAVILVFFYLIWGAFEWITAGGDTGKLTSARNRITQAVIGLIVLASTVAILVLVQRLLNVCILEFGSSCTAPPPAQDQQDLPPQQQARCTGPAECQGLSESNCRRNTSCAWSTNF